MSPSTRLSSRLWDHFVIYRRTNRHSHLQRTVRSQTAKRLNWQRWQRDEAILAELPTVEKIARIESRKFASHIDIRDLVGAGHVGLMQAVDRYKPENGSFSAFAYWRIRGAIIDSQKRRAYREEQNDSLDAIREAHNGWLPPALDQDGGVLPDEHASRAQIAERITAAMESLSEVDRQILVAHLDGEPLVRMSKRMGLGINAVRERWTEIQWWVGVIVRGE